MISSELFPILNDVLYKNPRIERFLDASKASFQTAPETKVKRMQGEGFKKPPDKFHDFIFQ